MSIASRIYIGMGLLIAAIIGVGGFATYQTNVLADTFVEYRTTARQSLLTSAVQEDIFEARLASSKYRLVKEEQYLDELRANLAEVTAVAEELTQLSEQYGGMGELTAIPELLGEYEQAMTEAFAFQQQREVLVDTTSDLGRKAREQLSQVMESALADGDAVASAAAGDAATSLMLARLYLERFLVSNLKSDADRSKAEVQNARIGLTDLLVELQNSTRRQLTQETMRDLDNFDKASAEVADVILQRNARYTRMDEIGPEVLARIETAVDAVVDRQNTLGPAGSATAESSILIVSVIVVIGTIIGAILSFFTVRFVKTRLSKITDDMGELADGNLDIQIERSTDQNEVGKMTNAMVVFLENARKARDLDIEVKAKEEEERKREEENRALEAKRQEEKNAQEQREREIERARFETMEAFQADMERVLGQAASGNFGERMSVEIDDQALVALANVINKLMVETERNIDDIVSCVGELSEGNLGTRIDGERQGAFKRMKDDLNSALTTLSSTMAGIMLSGRTVAENSAHMRSSADDMSKRAEHNAAAIEETSAAIEEMTSSIEQVVRNAKSADGATQKARTRADATRKVSDETEESIHAISEASEQINRIVKVIEDIAFQINLLALNAGVEAARAGDAGRGFTVVASEVRALAQKSQEAVQEIGQVIEQNNERVEAGVEKVALSRQALQEIIAEVEDASDQISAIATAVDEQSSGIREINTAVKSIDQASQVSAASLEEMTAASVSTSSEATALSDALQTFRGVSQNGAANVVSMPAKSATPSNATKPTVVASGGRGQVSADGFEDF